MTPRQRRELFAICIMLAIAMAALAGNPLASNPPLVRGVEAPVLSGGKPGL